MKKSSVTRVWIAGAVAMAAGLVAVGVGVILMLAYGGSWAQAPGGTNYEFAPSFNNPFWAGVVVVCVGGVVAFAGWIVQIIGWVGGMANANRLPDKTWFTILVIGGIIGFFFVPVGFAAMLAYIVAAPDGFAYSSPHSPVQGSSLQPAG